MPPGLYFYVNFGHIRLNQKHSNTKILARPMLRDLEWTTFYALQEARGFSGFKLDEEYTGNYAVLDASIPDDQLASIFPDIFNSKGEKKEFMHPRQLLTRQHPYHKGAPLYKNEAYNVLMLGSRDTGKTYMIGVGVVVQQ